MRIDGTIIRDRIFREVHEILKTLSESPTLALLVVGDNPVIEGFVGVKKRFAERLGVNIIEQRFPETVSEKELIDAVTKHARSEYIAGIVVQLPLPSHINTDTVLNVIPATKDVDVLSKEALTCFERGESKILPPVVGAVAEILDSAPFSPLGKRVLVVGHGRLVGAPVATWLRMQGADVEVIDKPSEHLAEHVRESALVVSGAGVPGLIKPEMLAPGVGLIDAGSSESLGKIVGDVDPQCEDTALFVTPVPGGVGPITVAVLFRNLVLLSQENR